jgi:hypothetical protein
MEHFPLPACHVVCCQEDMVSSTASGFLKALLTQLKAEWQQEQSTRPAATSGSGQQHWYDLWMPQLMDTLINGK